MSVPFHGQAVIRWSFIAEAQAQYQASLCGICGEQSGTESGFPWSILVSHWYHSTDAPILCSIHRPTILKPTLATDSNLK